MRRDRTVGWNGGVAGLVVPLGVWATSLAFLWLRRSVVSVEEFLLCFRSLRSSSTCMEWKSSGKGVRLETCWSFQNIFLGEKVEVRGLTL